MVGAIPTAARRFASASSEFALARIELAERDEIPRIRGTMPFTGEVVRFGCALVVVRAERHALPAR